MKEYRNPPNVHAPIAGYTHQIEIQSSERLLILSGQVGRTVDGIVPEDAAEQLKIAFDNLTLNLQAAGMDIEDIVKLTLYMAEEMEPNRRREVLASALKDHHPCMTLVYVAGLASPIYKVEIDAWASKGD